MDQKTLMNLVFSGSIQEVEKSILTDYGGTMNNKFALNTLIALCKTINNKEIIDSFSSNDIFNLTMLCCKNLSALTENDYEKYLLSIYHLVKYFCMKDLYENSKALCEHIDECCVQKQFKTDTYNYYIFLFHNSVITKRFHNDIFYYKALLSLRMQLLMKNLNMVNWFHKIKIYLSLLKQPEIDFNQRNQFCNDLITLFTNFKISIFNEDCMEEMYGAFLDVITTIIYDINHENTEYFFQIFYNVQTKINEMRQFVTAKEYTICIDIFDILLQTIIKDINNQTVNDVRILQDSRKKIEKLGENNLTIQMYKNFVFLVKCFPKIIDYYKCHVDCLNDIHISLHAELIKLLEIFGNNIYYGINLLEMPQNDIYTAIVAIISTGNIVDTWVRLGKNGIDELHQFALNFLKKTCKYINILKKISLEKYLSNWRIIGTIIYNISLTLYKQENYNYSKLYLHIFCQNVIELEGINNNNVCFENYLEGSLYLYAKCCSFLNERRRALTLLSLALFLCQNSDKKLFNLWIRIKYDVSDDKNKIKLITVKHMLFEEQNFIKQIYCDYVYNEKRVEHLLMQEIEFYAENWSSKVAMISACHEICLISNNIVNKTQAFILSLDKIELDEDEITHDLEETTNSVEGSDKIQDLICYSALSYISYQSQMLKIRKKNTTDMNNVYMPLTATRTTDEQINRQTDDDKYDDIVSSFDSLNIENLIHLYKMLDKCLNIWENMTKNPTKHVLNLINELNLMKIIKHAAYEYRLQNITMQMLKTWTVYMNFGKLFKNNVSVITSIGFILEYTDCTSKEAKNLEIEAEKLIDYYLDKENPEELDTFMTYYVNKSFGYYRSNLIEDGYKNLLKASKCLALPQASTLKLVEARVLFMETHYLIIACENKVNTHNDNILVLLQNAFTIIAGHYKKSWSIYVLAVLIEISLYTGWIYKWLRLPRETRCYTKQSFHLSQKYVLPIKTVQFLSLLSFVDLLHMNYSNCEVKLRGLRNILGYSSAKHIEVVQMQNISPIKEMKCFSIFEDEACNSPSFQSFLDAPTDRVVNNILGSPTLQRSPFKFPDIITHANYCDCFRCCNVEYQRLVLDVIHLESILNSYQEQNGQAREFFRGGLTMYNALQKKTNFFAPVWVKITDNTTVSVHLYKDVFHSYCMFMLDYSYYLNKMPNMKRAENIVDNILKLIDKKKHLNPYFWNEVMIQKLNLTLSDNEDIQSNKESEEECALTVTYGTVLPKTPDDKISQTTVTISLSPVLDPLPIKIPKKIAFDISFSSDDEENGKKLKTPENKKTLFKLESPGKTPAIKIPNIKIYTPKTVKPKKQLASLTDIKKNKQEPEAHSSKTETKQKIDKKVSERMKLLTEKLKAETKANENEKSKTRRVVRKNLMDDLDNVTQSVKKLTLNTRKDSAIDEDNEKATRSVKSTKEVKTKANGPKKYNRIRTLSSSSSSDSCVSADHVPIRKSSRIFNKK